ncbi:ras-related and estrogen-regulated growth inhibitor-like isoform X2 [Haemaphysalis longicornis]
MEEDAATTALEALEPINLVVIGKDGTGKTALIVRLLTRRFIHEYDPSLGGAVEQVNQAVRRKRAMDAKLSQNRPKTTVVKADDKAEPLTRPPASRHLGAGNAGKIRRAIYSVLLSVYPFTIDDDGESLSINLMDTAGKSRLEASELSWGDGFLIVVSLTCPESVRAAEIMHGWLEDSAPGKPLALAATKSDLVQARAVSSHELAELAERWNCELYETAATGEYEEVARPFLDLARKARTLKARRRLCPIFSARQLTPPTEGARRPYKARLLTK